MSTAHLVVPGIGPVPVTYTDSGTGQPVLLLHGGAGPDSVAGLGALLSEQHQVRILTPVHPGFNGTARPEGMASVQDLAAMYGRLLDELGLSGVVVIGSSIGGWIAAELALASDRVARLILLDAVGLDSAAHPVADFFSLTPDQVTDLSWANPEGHRIDPAAMTEAQRQAMAGNRAALLTYGGTSMADPTLASRLAAITCPTLLVWGEADRIATPGYGREYARAIPGAAFRLLPGAGHLPQLEAPRELLSVVSEFAGLVRGRVLG